MITQVTPTVAVGNSTDAKEAKQERFDAILNVAIDLDIKDEFRWRHKVGLVDGPGNDTLTFMSAVLLLYSLVRSKKRVLVHCHEGKSRSVMVCACFVSITEGISLDEVLKKLMPERGVDIYRPELYKIASSIIPLVKNLK
jgi:protein-tyrosine phosphatase